MTAGYLPGHPVLDAPGLNFAFAQAILPWPWTAPSFSRTGRELGYAIGWWIGPLISGNVHVQPVTALAVHPPHDS